MVSYLPILMVILDVENSNNEGGFNMELLWLIQMAVQGIFVWIIFPIAILYYEGDEQVSIVSSN